MGEELVTKLLAGIKKIEWPAATQATLLGRQTYEVGLDKVNGFRGDPKVLASALHTFQTGNSLPYAYAGAAYTLLAAAREPDGSYAQSGLEAAMAWLEKAQELTPDLVEVNVVEAFIYIYSKRYQDARLILDYLMEQDPTNHYLLTAEIAFWENQGEVQEAIRWYYKAIKAAESVPQRVRLRRELGDCLLKFGLEDKALEVYKDVVNFDQKNGWLWHNMSVAYWRQQNYKEAARCNKKALSLIDIPQARQMADALKKKIDTGMLGRLFGK